MVLLFIFPPIHTSQEHANKKWQAHIRHRKQAKIAKSGPACDASGRPQLPLAEEYADALKGTNLRTFLCIPNMTKTNKIIIIFAPFTQSETYRDRSRLGGPCYRCQHCGASFWWDEQVEIDSSLTKRLFVFNRYCNVCTILIY